MSGQSSSTCHTGGLADVRQTALAIADHSILVPRRTDAILFAAGEDGAGIARAPLVIAATPLRCAPEPDVGNNVAARALGTRREAADPQLG
jgi:hypothetical protein